MATDKKRLDCLICMNPYPTRNAHYHLFRRLKYLLASCLLILRPVTDLIRSIIDALVRAF